MVERYAERKREREREREKSCDRPALAISVATSTVSHVAGFLEETSVERLKPDAA